MSEAQARPAAALLARKGSAAPADAATDAARAAAPTPALALAPDLVSLPEAYTPAKAAPPQPASLLPIDFLAGRHGAYDPSRIASDQPEAVFAPLPAPLPAPGPALGPTFGPADDAVVNRPGAALPEVSAKPAAKPGTKPATKPEGPRPNPAFRIDAGVKLAARPEPRRFPALAAGLALVLGAAGYGYLNGWFEAGPQAPAQIEAEQIQPEAAETNQLPTGMPTGTPTGTRAESPTDLQPAASSAPEADPIIKADAPSIDVVRVEPDGAAVIAGRAAPGAELILLDNGSPIGTAQADSYGEWVFVPIEPLPNGAHDFGLVIKKIEGGASVPSLEKMPAAKDTAAPGVRGINEPGTVAGAVAAVPIPPRKPIVGTKHAAAAQAQPFVVQIGSVKTRAGAQREWRVLRRRFPELLSDLSLSLDEAKLSGGNTVVRLRTGGFGKQAEAAELCARLAAKHQDCLVVRITARR